MTREEFEKAARGQNAKRNAEVQKARDEHGTCDVVPMLAFGGIPFCRAHHVMGPCPYRKERSDG